MRFLIYISLIILVSIVLFYLLNVGYYRRELFYYDIVNNGGLSSYLNYLFRFDLMVAIFNFLLLIFSCLFLSKSKFNQFKVRFYILIGFLFFNVMNSLIFLMKNYMRNHHDVFELNVFIVLLKTYGEIANLIYIAPLILSSAMLLLFLFIVRKWRHEWLWFNYIEMASLNKNPYECGPYHYSSQDWDGWRIWWSKLHSWI